MTLFRWIDFAVRGDERGFLVVIEEGKNIPFEIKRVYYIFGTEEGVARGFHAHKSLQQVAVCVRGKCRMILDNGRVRGEAWLDSPSKGLLVGDMVWREMHDFSPDCVLIVFANEYYDEGDYIRDYQNFLELLL
ncbi:FdtA/QdtA family cupin domain-containing protein [Desulfobotulus sp. H1]|uniref:FdtA/QdtA family cupin domain-containing protein n=1 Tax=Desulfobotulus pelophilus TaxID=2823377 RepID=A0ABT3NBR6_9BACT|nr:FdtA/QdtA family cupin domain-containing protein [Desulfobotulus pelophilus]MCW7754899.1 FdtA/QdtA family cupin domain-containing protein [Desulfobotulus pelophilus]